MDAPRAAVLVVGLNLVAVWIAAAAGSAVQQALPAARAESAADRSVAHVSEAIGEAKARLAARDTRPPASLAGVRNPFLFGPLVRVASTHRAVSNVRAEGRSAPRAASSAVGEAPAAAEIRLVGMAESREGDGVHRTAVISAGGELVLATVGTELGGRYRVHAVGETSVELDDLLGGAPLILRLKS